MEEKYIGYLKYTGESVSEGYLDARKSAEALLGLDEILRYFVASERPDLRDLDFEIPVRIEKGSWIAFIPQTIDQWILAGLGITATAYLATAATKIAEKDFKGVGLRDVFKSAIKSAQWVIKIGSHVGTISRKRFDNAKIRQRNGKVFIDIPNANGDLLEVPKKNFDAYIECPEKIFSRNVSLVEKDRNLEIGVFEKGQEIRRVTITEKEKSFFYTKGDESNILFPELKHGEYVELEGYITKGNERTNTIGFEYEDHVLTCKPNNGHIITFKNKIISQLENHFFPKVLIKGIVNRTEQNNLYKGENRPQIIFTDLVPLEKLESKRSLFDKLDSRRKKRA